MLTDLISSITLYITNVSQGNQFMAAAMFSVISLTTTYLMRSAPKGLYDLLKNQLTTSLTVNNSDYCRTYDTISDFVRNRVSDSSSRTSAAITVFASGEPKVLLSIGYGRHIMYYANSFILVSKRKLESNGTYIEKEEIKFTKFGRSHDLFRRLIEENQTSKKSNEIYIYEIDDKSWKVASIHRKQSMDDLALDPEIKAMFRNMMDEYVGDPSRYYKLGLDHKLTVMLHGLPGTGKTSIIRSLASDYDYGICPININSMNDSTLNAMITKAPENTFIVLEDIDSSKAVHDRKIGGSDCVIRKEPSNDRESLFGVSLSGVLNALQGVASLDGKVIFMTTNALKSLDPALYRDSRVDRLIELPLLRPDVIKEHITSLYPEIDSTYEFSEMTAAELHSCKEKARWDHVRLVEELDSKKLKHNGV